MLTADDDAECGALYRTTAASHCLIRGLVEQVLLYGKAMRPTLGISYAPPQVSEQRLVERGRHRCYMQAWHSCAVRFEGAVVEILKPMLTYCLCRMSAGLGADGR